jgi:AmmeMemoRadiSam system protein A
MADANSVSYASVAYVVGKRPAGAPMAAPKDYESSPPGAPPLDEDLGRRLLRLARATLSTELTGTDEVRRALRELPADRAELTRRQAVFVTLNRTDPEEIARHGKLRGCIGQVAPVHTLPEAVVVAARNAALNDARFPTVRPHELPRLSVELTVLSTPRPVASWREIELGRHGIVLRSGRHRAVYLPRVPIDQGWTLEETLGHLSRKAGLPSDGWREGASFELFEGQIFEEHMDVRGEAHDS